jgi:hypothetical protein
VASVFKQLLQSFGVVMGSVPPAAAQEWALTTSKNPATGRVTIFRYIKAFTPDFKQTDLPVKVILSWSYKGSNGQPLALDSKSMNAFEDLLEPVIGEDGFATLALVSTGNDLREWTYYAKSQDEFMKRLSRAHTKQSPYPIDVHAVRDANWSAFKEFLATVAG